MERFTISLESDLAEAFDDLIRERGYASRSEAVRDLLRQQLAGQAARRRSGGLAIAHLSYVYNHHERDLCERLMSIQHAHHDLTISSTHAHLDHEQCLEGVILKGPLDEIRRFADAITAERGVRHGQLNLVPVAMGATHQHGAGKHRHLKPRH